MRSQIPRPMPSQEHAHILGAFAERVRRRPDIPCPALAGRDNPGPSFRPCAGATPDSLIRHLRCSSHQPRFLAALQNDRRPGSYSGLTPAKYRRCCSICRPMARRPGHLPIPASSSFCARSQCRPSTHHRHYRTGRKLWLDRPTCWRWSPLGAHPGLAIRRVQALVDLLFANAFPAVSISTRLPPVPAAAIRAAPVPAAVLVARLHATPTPTRHAYPYAHATSRASGIGRGAARWQRDDSIIAFAKITRPGLDQGCKR